MLLFSCDLEETTVTKSVLSASLNGSILEEQTRNDTLVIRLDRKDDDKDNSIKGEGYFELSCLHYNDEEELPNLGFTFECATLPFVTKNATSAYMNLSNGNITLGEHTVSIKSSVDKKFDKTFYIFVKSEVDTLSLSYNIISPIKDLIYQKEDEPSAVSGTVSGAKNVIYLATNTIYSLKVEAGNKANLGNLTFTTSGTSSADLPLLTLDGNENATKTLTTSAERTDEALVEAYKQSGATEGLPTLTIRLDGTEIAINYYVILRQYSEISIDEDNRDKNLIKYISLTRDDKVKNYTINVLGNIADGAIQAFLSTGTQNEETVPIPESGYFTSGVHYAKSTLEAGGEQTYFDVYFDGEKREVQITPRKDTVYNNKNIDFYLHLRDASENYLGYWKILVGGIVEKIELSASTLDGNPQKSGIIKATVYPQSADVSVLWYISDKQYFPNAIEQSPSPSEDPYSRSLISMTSPLSSHLNDAGKTYTMLMKNRINQSGIKNDEYYNSTSSIPLMENGISTLLYSLGANSGKAYLTAVVIKNATNGTITSDNDYKIYKSIPLTISSNGEISVHSVIGVSKTVVSEGRTYTLDPYKDENGERISLPNRELGQRFPDTLEDGKYGDATRSFYFPHNAVSSIDIDIAGTDETVKITSSAESNKLFTVNENQKSNGITLTITPYWFTYYQDALRNDKKVFPPKNKNEQNEAFGSFSEYIGTSYLTYEIGKTKGNLRIVIYDNNLYI